MASTFSTNLALELIGTGDQAGTWGITTNTNLGTLIEQAISGYVTQAVATGTDTTITIPDGATGVARNMYIELTGTGGASTNLIVPANKKLYFIFNNSTGAVTVKVSGQTGVSVPAGKKMVLVSNGTDIVNAANYVADFGSNSATITQLTSTSATITNLTSTSLTLSNNPTLSGGTANGVLYLNGSKVATSGSAVTYDGTTFATSGAARFQASGNYMEFATNVLTSSSSSGAHIRSAVSSESNPTYSWSGDTNTGIFNPTADQIAFTLAGGEVSRFTTTGLGIGTSSPAYKLDVSGTARISNGGDTYVGFGANKDNYWTTGTTSGVQVWRNSAGSEFMRLDSSGNLGIGTDSPSGKFHVKLATNKNVLYDTGGVGSCSRITAGNDALSANVDLQIQALNLILATAGNERARIDSSGNLGLGTTSPDIYSFGSSGRYLTVQAQSGTTFSLMQLVSDGTNSGGVTFGNATIRRASIDGLNGSALTFSTNGTNSGTTVTERARITSAGNLGVGTTNPSARISAYGSVDANYGTIYGADTSSQAADVGGVLALGGYKTSTSSEAIFAKIKGGKENGTAGNEAGYLAFFTNNNTTYVERARITSGGDFGIGTSSPGEKLEVAGNIKSTGNSSTVTPSTNTQSASFISTNASGNFFHAIDNSTGAAFGAGAYGRVLYSSNAYPMAFFTNDTERARITSGGDLLVGTTTQLGSARATFKAGSTLPGISIGMGNSAGTYAAVIFYDGDNTDSGSIDVDNSANTTAYTTSSDYRLKQDVQPMTNGLEMVSKLNPVTWNWKKDPKLSSNGFIAHELQEICPNAVTGKKDEVDENGKPIYQGVDTSFLVATLTAAIKEQQTMINELKAKVAALETK